jgi:hypothetical protein
MLTQSQVAHYMVEENLISPECVVDGDLRVTEASSRNRNFIVLSERGVSYLLKQGIDADGVETITHESKIYRFLQHARGSEELKRFLPRFVKYDTNRKILVLELLREAKDFHQYHIRNVSFSVSFSAMLGKALGVLHDITAQALTDLPASAQKKRIPWALGMDRPSLQKPVTRASKSFALYRTLLVSQRFLPNCAQVAIRCTHPQRHQME